MLQNFLSRSSPLSLFLFSIPVVGIVPTRCEAQNVEDRNRIVLVGDSTVTEESGWGLGFRELVNEKAELINLAKSGRSSRSYRAEGWWQKCLDAKPHFVVIQFGHNDQTGKGPERESDPQTAFRDHLRSYVDEALQHGIKPVLFSPLTRRRWTDEGKIVPTLSEYAEATMEVAREKVVSRLDLHALSLFQCEQFGPTAFRAFEPMDEKGADHTHLNREGSRAVAQLIVQELMVEVPELARLIDQQRLREMITPKRYAKELKLGNLELIESNEGISIKQGDRLVLNYNKVSPKAPSGIDRIFERSGFLHPVASPSGQVVTAAFPYDHAHQHGIFSAWVQTQWQNREIDFWNLAGKTGRVLHQRTIDTFAEHGRLGFVVDLSHRAMNPPEIDLLRERWTVTAIPTDGKHHCFEIASLQMATTSKPLLIKKYHYGGFAVRGPVEWLSLKDSELKKKATVQNATEESPGNIVNEHGSDRIRGNHEPTRWVSLTGKIDGKTTTISVLGHRDNYRSPQNARLHPTKPYFVFSPCVEDEFTIEESKPLHSRYRYLITDAPPDNNWLKQQWEAWHSETN
jgi:lysophospholipase L1-like esterase